jgi:hypothetical protein
MLRQLLLVEGRLGEGWRSRLLLCYAARHSNAECLQEVLAARQMHASRIRTEALVMPDHLEMAAARTDPWAAGGQGGCMCGNKLLKANGSFGQSACSLAAPMATCACSLHAPTACSLQFNVVMIPARSRSQFAVCRLC